ncbi:hypothetical protein BGZ52_003083 [Haplosporangium bisporale]|nr:hypothetical protein BGZ52_003083 [Haplosporangium bisporale]
MASSDTSDLFYRLLGNPQDNVTKAISAFVQEFEVLLNWIKGSSRLNPTLTAKETFQKDIDDAKEAFDEEMALRHADVIKQYVGTFVQQIDHY